jgi:hypothetical protein
MNGSFTPSDPRFDRLVDGELSPEAYRALLASLDDEPDGWRQCALAFLESQALRHDLPAALRAPAPPEKPTPPPPLSGGVLRKVTYFGTLAASVLLAFALGGLTNRPAPREPGRSGDSDPAAQVNPMLAENRPSPATGSAGRREPQPIGNVRLVVDGEGAAPQQGINVPVYDLKQIGNQWLSQEPALPRELIEQLERMGHRVQHHQQLIPVPLDDGREVVVPVDGYQITPVRQRAY